MNQDRRKTARKRLQAFASLETKGRHPNDQALGAVVDVSRSGVGIRTGQPPIKGQVVHLRLALDDVIHEISGVAKRVARRDAHVFDVGIDWSEVTDAQIAFLEAFLRAQEDGAEPGTGDANGAPTAGPADVILVDGLPESPDGSADADAPAAGARGEDIDATSTRDRAR